MHDLPKDVARRVIPRWRKLSDTPQTELFGAERKAAQPLNLDAEIAETIARFEERPSIETAAEAVILSSFKTNEPKLLAPANFLLKHGDIPVHLEQLARSAALSTHQDRSLPAVATNPRIAKLKRYLTDQPRNSIAHVEIARLYASIGELKKAGEHFRVALALSPTSRFVLRAVTRFDVHRENAKRAWEALREGAKYDPWLASARLAIADLLGLPLPRTKSITTFFETHHPSQISELAASLATLELGSGSHNRAKKFFRLSSQAPTDNVIAQLQWASRQHGIKFNHDLLSQSLAFEARAHSLRANEKWDEAVQNCKAWLEDEPFSVRPAHEGGFLAGELLQDFCLTEDFARRGLRANPHDFTLLNNLSYALIMQGKIDEPRFLLERLTQARLSGSVSIAVTATCGLLSYRTGDAIAGAALYLDAIQRAHELGLAPTKQLAFLHFISEEVNSGKRLSEAQAKHVEEFFTSKRVSRELRRSFDNLLKPKLRLPRISETAHNGVDVQLEMFEEPSA